MADIKRFLDFIEEIATSGMWEYGDGESMTEDANEFLDLLDDLSHVVEVLLDRERDDRN